MVALLKGDGAAIMTLFIGVIIAVVMIGSIADSVDPTTGLRRADNVTFTAPNGPIGGTNITILNDTGRAVDTSEVTTIIINATASDTISTGNFTVYNDIVSGESVIRIGTNNGDYNGSSMNITLGYQPYGYLSLSSARSVATLITLFASLAIVVFSLVMLIKKGSLGAFVRGMR